MTCPDLWNMVEDSGNISVIPEYSEDQKDNSAFSMVMLLIKPTVSNAPGYSEGGHTGAKLILAVQAGLVIVQGYLLIVLKERGQLSIVYYGMV